MKYSRVFRPGRRFQGFLLSMFKALFLLQPRPIKGDATTLRSDFRGARSPLNLCCRLLFLFFRIPPNVF